MSRTILDCRRRPSPARAVGVGDWRGCLCRHQCQGTARGRMRHDEASLCTPTSPTLSRRQQMRLLPIREAMSMVAAEAATASTTAREPAAASAPAMTLSRRLLLQPRG